MWVPVAVWQPCELLYTCYLLTYLLYVMRPTVTFRVSEHYNALAFIKIRRDLVSTHFIGFCILFHKLNTYRKKWNIRTIRLQYKKVKVYSPYSITEGRIPELIPVLGSQPSGDVSHKPGSRLPLLSAKPAVTTATLKRAATNFAAWWTEARWVWTVCLRLLIDSVAAAIWTQALLRLSPAR